MSKSLGEFGWTTIGGQRHYGDVYELDSNVIHIHCRYCGKNVATEGTEEELRAFRRVEQRLREGRTT